MPADNRVFVHRIDASDVIAEVNEAWQDFARENANPDLAVTAVGNPLWRYVTGYSIRQIYETVFDKVRKSQKAVTLNYRCDSPEVRRFMTMEIEPVDDNGLEFRNRIVKLESRDPVRLIDIHEVRDAGLVSVCAWCRRVATPEWLEMEEAVNALGLFDRDTQPNITHAICPECLETALQEAAAD